MKTSNRPSPPPIPTSSPSTPEEAYTDFIHVLRIRVGGVDHLFFGPCLPVEKLNIEEIEILGMTTRKNLIEALEKGPQEFEGGVQ